MVPSDPRRASPMVMSSPAAARVTTPARRVSQVPRPFSRRAPSPLTPGSRFAARVGCFAIRTGCIIFARPATPAFWPPPLSGHPRFSVTRPNRVRSRYSSRRRLPRLRPTHCWTRPLGRLHVQPTIYMADSFQPARTAKLGLAHRRHEELFICALCARNSSLFLRVFVSHACRSRTGSPPKASARRRARRSW